MLLFYCSFRKWGLILWKSKDEVCELIFGLAHNDNDHVSLYWAFTTIREQCVLVMMKNDDDMIQISEQINYFSIGNYLHEFDFGLPLAKLVDGNFNSHAMSYLTSSSLVKIIWNSDQTCKHHSVFWKIELIM